MKPAENVMSANHHNKHSPNSSRVSLVPSSSTFLVSTTYDSHQRGCSRFELSLHEAAYILPQSSAVLLGTEH